MPWQRYIISTILRCNSRLLRCHETHAFRIGELRGFMVHGKPVFDCFIRALRLAVPAALGASLAGPAQATTEMDCGAIAHDAVQVDLGAATSEIRHIALRAGETLRFTFEAEPGPFGTLTLIEGAGSPRALLVGPSGTAISFTAPHSGAFGFQFAKDGDVAARFTVVCAADPRAPRRDARAPAPALGAATIRPLGDGHVASEEAPGLDLAIAGSGDEGLPSKKAAAARPEAAVGASQGGVGPDVKLKWLDRRYEPSGPEGPQVDTTSSGVEIGVKYKLESAVSIGALAQFNPAAEMLFGGQRSLADQGWMAGPVATVKVAPGLVLDARAAWGEGESGPGETAAAAAQLRLVSARLANQHAFGALRVAPSVNFNYLEQVTHGPDASAAQQATGAGRIDVGPELAYHMDLGAATFIEPRAVVGGFWDFESLSNVGAGTAAHAEVRLKAEAGVTIGVRDGPRLQALGALETGDAETPDAWTGRLQLNVPLK
jgi:hypothetical protein